MPRRLLPILVASIASTAAADPKQILESQLTNLCGDAQFNGEKPPKFAAKGDDVFIAPKDFGDGRPGPNELGCFDQKVLGAEAADKKSAWIAGDIGAQEIGCGAAPCPPPPPQIPEFHGTVLVERDGKAFRYVAWMFGTPISDKDQAAAVKKGVTLEPIERGIGAGAEDAVKVFEGTLGDPKLLAASVSKRKDVVLYGSELRERTVGGDKVAAKLAAWKLSFKVRDGIQAGVTASKTVAWIAANVDATSQKKPKDKPTPYRVLFLYEKTGTAWQLVHAQFAFAR